MTREPLQFGAEIFGHAGLEADLEVQELALDGLAAIGARELTIDLGDARVVRSVLAGVPLDASALTELVAALTAKDGSTVQAMARDCPAETRAGLTALLDLYGGDGCSSARARLPARAPIAAALDDLAWLARHVHQSTRT
jgi:ATP phosphoribosyltransferase regulatory subunit